jgi:hypothetical protein
MPERPAVNPSPVKPVSGCDAALGEALKQAGLALVESHTPESWKQQFALAGRAMALGGEPFTAEDLIPYVGLPTSPNAIGAAMHALAKELKLVRVGYRPAKRPSRHAGAVAVWRAP